MSRAAANRTILLSPPGAGAIATIRVVGTEAVGIVDAAFHAAGRTGLASTESGRLRYGRLVDEGETIDDAVVCVVPGAVVPTVEITTHGGVRIVERVLQMFDRLGAPLVARDVAAEPQFPCATAIERDVLNALARAKTPRGVHFVARQRTTLTGELESIAELAPSQADEGRRRIERLCDGYATARLLLDSARVVLVGPPNAGKSTLFNRMVGRLAAVVSPHAGTTRDWVSECIELAGVPITLIDTAGAQSGIGPLEDAAARSTEHARRNADLHVLVVDGSSPLREVDLGLMREARASDDWITVVAKLDDGLAWVRTDETEELLGVPGLVQLSARTGVHIDRLETAILSALGFGVWKDVEPVFFCRRQVEMADRLLSRPKDFTGYWRDFVRKELIGR